jgi:choice-of-anchor C domain-containing protein
MLTLPFPLARRVLSLVLLTGLTIAAPPALGAYSYSTDFESGAGPEWTNRTTEVSPSGRKFLGRFSDQTVGLSFADLPEHGAVRVSFDLFVIQSWDGNATTSGPDVWDLRVAGGPVLAHTTFSNVEFPQSYPGFLPGGNHAARTGAAENGTLGYSFGSDAVYHLTFTFPHAERSLLLNFSALGLEALDNESWGLDNVTVVPLDSLGENLVANGGMESPDVPGAFTGFATGTTIGAWRVESGNVDLTAGYWQAAAGKQSVDLTGDTPGTIAQDVPTTPGQPYTLRFAMAGHPLGLDEGSPAEKRMEVWWNGALLDTTAFDVTGRTTYDMGWRYHEYSVVGAASGAATQLRFTSRTDGYFGPALDMVSVTSDAVAGPAGDVNQDGRTDMTDAVIAGRLLQPGGASGDPDAVSRADVYPWSGTGGRVHGDGALTAADVDLLVRFAGGLQ